MEVAVTEGIPKCSGVALPSVAILYAAIYIQYQSRTVICCAQSHIYTVCTYEESF